MTNTFIVGCSGGPDSMALLETLYKSGSNIIVAHVNYQKRSSAIRDQKIVESYCEKRKIPFFVCTPLYDQKTNFQAWARKVRYDFFVELAHRFHTPYIAIAHQKDDHIETYLFQKKRGMLCEHFGLSKKSSYQGCIVVRPLLEWTKKDCIKFCEENHVPYGIDESNLEDHYTRNKIRHSIVDKLSPDQKDTLSMEIEEVNRAWDHKQKEIEDFLKDWDQNVDTLDHWLKLEEFLYQKTKHRYGKKECVDLLKQIQSPCLIDIGSYELESYQGRIYIEEKEEPLCVRLSSLTYGSFPGFKLFKEGKTIEGIRVSKEDFPLCFRNPKPGDAITLRYGSKKLNRFFIDRKIPKLYRKKWIVVENQKKEIIFVPGIGCDVQHFSVKPNLFMLQ